MNEEQLQYLEQVVSKLDQEWFTIRLVEVRGLIAEIRSLRAKLDAVPVDDIKRVNAAAENDGYSNWAVAVWLDELAQPEVPA